MQLSVSFSSNPDSLDSLVIEHKISEGKFKIYQVYSPSLKTKFALKVFPKNPFGESQLHKEQLSLKLHHPNVIQSYSAIFHHKDYDFHLTELAKFGDFFNVVEHNLISHSDSLIRTYFSQLIEGLEYIHSQGVAHLDIKLENLMLGSDFIMKIIDFDHAQRTSDNYITSAGTQAYRAPEILDGTCKDLAAADVYSAGVILYTLKAGEYPFREAFDSEKKLKRFDEGFNHDKAGFWQKKALIRRERGFFSDDFKELMNGMLEEDPCKRFTIIDVKKSKWFNDNVLEEKTLKKAMKAIFVSKTMKAWNSKTVN